MTTLLQLGVYSLKSACIFIFSLTFFLLMVFTARCVCTKHSTWSHGNVSPDPLQVADPEELRFCEVDSSKNKGRKRKICLACCGRLAAKIKCMRLEVRLYFCNCHVLFSHVPHILSFNKLISDFFAHINLCLVG